MVKSLDSHSCTALLLRAMQFAAHKHRDQRRKNSGRTPYINHPLAVANLLWFDGGIRDQDVLVAAILHDTVEDTDTSFAELETEFGTRVRTIVEEVTDDKTLPVGERKRRQVQKASRISKQARLVKLADKIANLRDIYQDPPEGWSRERKIDYYTWSKRVIDGLRGANDALESLFDLTCERFFQSLMEPPSGNHHDPQRI